VLAAERRRELLGRIAKGDAGKLTWSRARQLADAAKRALAAENTKKAGPLLQELFELLGQGAAAAELRGELGDHLDLMRRLKEAEAKHIERRRRIPPPGTRRRRTGSKATALAAVTPARVAMPAVVKEALKPLPPQQQRFVVNYCGPARGNATLAAKLAGAQGNYQTVAARASQMLADERVRSAVDAWMTAYALSGAEVTAQLKDMAEANFGPFLEFVEDGADPGQGGRLVIRLPDEDTWEAHKHWIRAIEADPVTGQVTRVILHDALAARRELAKILKLYSDQPIVNLTLYLQKLSDSDLMGQLREARSALERGIVSGTGS
jgi:hypothetical protein